MLKLQQERKKFWRHSRRGASPRGAAGKEKVPSSRDTAIKEKVLNARQEGRKFKHYR